MPAESVHLKWKSTVLEGKTKGIAVNLTTMPIFKNLFITISTTLKLVDLLKMPSNFPFKVNITEARVDNLYYREVRRKLDNGEIKSSMNEEKVLGDTKNLPYNEIR